MTVFQDVIQSSLVDKYHCFTRNCCVHHMSLSYTEDRPTCIGPLGAQNHWVFYSILPILKMQTAAGSSKALVMCHKLQRGTSQTTIF